MVEKDLKPRDILTLDSFRNAIAADMAIGGSSNTVLHLLAIAKQAQVELSLDEFDRISEIVPHISKLNPSGKYHIHPNQTHGQGLRAPSFPVSRPLPLQPHRPAPNCRSK